MFTKDFTVPLLRCGISSEPALHQGRPVLLLTFDSDPALETLLLKHKGRWTPPLNRWLLPAAPRVLRAFIKAAGMLKGVDTDPPEIRDLRQAIGQKGYSPSTEQAYAQALSQCLRDLHPRKLGELGQEAVEQYLQNLAQSPGWSQAAVHTMVSAIRFYQEVVLGRPRDTYRLQRPKKHRSDPDVFSKEEITRLIEAIENPKHRAMIILAYSCGLRVSEVAHLRTQDVDARNMVVTVAATAGPQSRSVPLAPKALRYLREYLAASPPDGPFLFAGRKEGTAYSTRSLQAIVERAKDKAGIHKKGSMHALRHSYATHLLEKGADVACIQKVLGHADGKASRRYQAVVSGNRMNLPSPVEDLCI